MAVTRVERQETILDGATRFFAEVGYQNTDVQQIADALKIGKGTVYRYFPTKKDLFFATVDRAIAKLNDYIHSHAQKAADDESRIKAALHAYVDFFREYPLLAELFVQERAAFRQRENPSYAVHVAREKSEWTPVLNRLKAKGKIRISNPDKIINSMMLLTYGFMFTRAFQYPAAGDDLFLTGIDVILHGIFTKDPL